MNLVRSASKLFREKPLEKEFTLNNGLQLLVKSGDVTRETAGGVVVGEDEDFSGRGAVAETVLKAGGKKYKHHRDKLKDDINRNGLTFLIYSCPAGGNLKYEYVLHAIITQKNRLPKDWAGLLKAMFFDMVRVAEEKRLKDLVTPLLGTGRAGRPMHVIVREALDGLSMPQLKTLRKVTILEYDRKKAEAIKVSVQQILSSGTPTDLQHHNGTGNGFHGQPGQVMSSGSPTAPQRHRGVGNGFRRQPGQGMSSGSPTAPQRHNGTGNDFHGQPGPVLPSRSPAVPPRYNGTGNDFRGQPGPVLPSRSPAVPPRRNGTGNGFHGQPGQQGRSESEQGRAFSQASSSVNPVPGESEPSSVPDGKMVVTTKPSLRLEGFPDCGTIVIEYSFPNGTQGPQHPAPGQPYKGTFRRAFLPDNQEGRRVVELLQKAFDSKLTFQLQQSGPDQEWGVELADIPHKTSLRGGPQGNGYPDPHYLWQVDTALKKYGLS